MSETVTSPEPAVDRSAGNRSVRTSNSASVAVVPIHTNRTSFRVLSYASDEVNLDVAGLVCVVTCSGADGVAPVASTVMPKTSDCSGTVLTEAR